MILIGHDRCRVYIQSGLYFFALIESDAIDRGRISIEDFLLRKHWLVCVSLVSSTVGICGERHAFS